MDYEKPSFHGPDENSVLKLDQSRYVSRYVYYMDLDKFYYMKRIELKLMWFIAQCVGNKEKPKKFDGWHIDINGMCTYKALKCIIIRKRPTSWVLCSIVWRRVNPYNLLHGQGLLWTLPHTGQQQKLAKIITNINKIIIIKIWHFSYHHTGQHHFFSQGYSFMFI